MKHIAILGSTGSIGTQTLDVVNQHPEEFHVVALTANKNVETIITQIKQYSPEYVVLYDREAAKIVQNQCSHIKVLYGLDGLLTLCSDPSIDLIVNALVGINGLSPTLCALEHDKVVALANKESLVAGGAIINENIKKNSGKIIPIDSEHSAIFQCIQNCEHQEIEKIILTCSGGPFSQMTRAEMGQVSKAQALQHPNWNMGPKITIDSATLMNKGLEVIEAVQLFDLAPQQVEVVIHPQSAVHSFVQFRDGNILAQIGPPDMRMAISYALHYPRRPQNNFKRLSLIDQNWNFRAPDLELFPCLQMAYEAMKMGNTFPTVLNAANEKAVELFLDEQIDFLEIEKIVAQSLSEHQPIKTATLTDIQSIDQQVRDSILKSHYA